MVLAYSPDGNTLAAGSVDRQIYFCHISSIKFFGTVEPHSDQYGHHALAFSSDGKILASGSSDGTVRLIDTESRRVLCAVKSAGPVNGLGWSLDGKVLVCGGTVYRDFNPYGWLTVFSPSGRILKSVDGEFGPVTQLTFAADNTYLASSHHDGMVRLWNVKSWQPMQTLRGNSGEIWTLARSPDNTTVAAAGYDATVRIWNVASGAAQGTIVSLPELQGLMITPTGDHRGTPQVERHLVYVALTDDGRQETYTLDEFTNRFGWKNNPDTVHLTKQ
jgi:WD40 repeat protein